MPPDEVDYDLENPFLQFAYRAHLTAFDLKIVSIRWWYLQKHETICKALGMR